MSDGATEQIRITQVRSGIGSHDGHRRTLRALGLRGRHHEVTQPDRPEIRGMIAKVAHLVEVAYAGDGEALDLEPGQEPKGEGNPPAGQSVADDESAEIAEGIEEAVAAVDDEAAEADDETAEQPSEEEEAS